MLDKILLNMLWSMGWVVGKLPMFMQFALGDLVYLFIYRLVGYRVEVVRENLQNSFPEKSQKELREIEHKFYKQLADIFVETFALVSMSEKQIRERMVFENYDVIAKAANKSPVIANMAHFGTWEYTISFALYVTQPVLAVYHPLYSKVVDRFYIKMRSRFGTKPVAMASTSREMLRCLKRGENPVVALISDQTPPRPIIKNWIPFLNQPTPFFMGTERLAHALKASIFFGHMSKPKRGHYVCHFELIYDGLEVVDEDIVTKRYASKLESMITETPSLWMWSHKRWKHKPE